MREKKLSYLLSVIVLFFAALCIYACSSSSDSGPAGPPISDTPMVITQSSSEDEVEDMLDLVSMQNVNDYVGFTDLSGSLAFSLQSIGGAFTDGNLSELTASQLFPGVIGTCPVITYTDRPIGSPIPDPFVITIDYGTGCIPAGQTEMYSGLITFTLHNLNWSISGTAVTLSASYSLDFDELITEDGRINGNVAGSISITTNIGGSTFSGNLTATFTDLYNLDELYNGTVSISLTDILMNDLTNQLSGTVGVTYTNFTTSTETINGTVSAALNVNTATELGTITYTYTNFTDGTETYTGTLTATKTVSDMTFDCDMATSSGPITMTLVIIEDDTLGTTTVNTVGTGTYHGVSITITDVVIEDSCNLSPTSGTMVLSDGTTTATITFGPACGDINIVIS